MPEPWEMIDAFQRGANGLAPPSGAGLNIPYEQGQKSVAPPPVIPEPMLPRPLELPPMRWGGSAPYPGAVLSRSLEGAWLPLSILGFFVAPASTILSLAAGLVGGTLTAAARVFGARVRLGRAFSASFLSMAGFLAVNYAVEKFAGVHLPGLWALAPGAAAFAAVNAFALRSALPGLSGACKSLLLSAATLVLLPMLCVEFIQYANHQKLLPPDVVLKDLIGVPQAAGGSRAPRSEGR